MLLGAEAESRGLDIWTDVSKFQKGIKGIVAQTMTTGVGRVSIATFADEVFNIIAEQPKVTQEEAKLRAAAIVTSYTGMNILELGNKASSTQADVLTLLLFTYYLWYYLVFLICWCIVEGHF